MTWGELEEHHGMHKIFGKEDYEKILASPKISASYCYMAGS